MTGSHIKYQDGKNFLGTSRYASINTHRGLEQSRRDDLESLGYVLVYLLKGKLPWQDVTALGKDQEYKKILEMKLSIQVDYLCEWLPSE